MINITQQILNFIKEKQQVTSSDVANFLSVSRQHAHALLRQMVESDQISKSGSARSTRYSLIGANVGDSYSLRLKNINLEEHAIVRRLEAALPGINRLNENVFSIFQYAFSEMLNNAIEHSQSKNIIVTVNIDFARNLFNFEVRDFGIGVFRNVMKKFNLAGERDAMAHLTKGKVTTAPRAHSGEGIFFTSRTADLFILDSFGHQLRVDNSIPDLFIEESVEKIRGTRVNFSIALNSKRHLGDIFKEYEQGDVDHGFNKTDIHVRLFTYGTIYVSRSQARRILQGLEKFKTVIFDFDRVPSVGQAFVDEVFRVFKEKHPDITLTPVNMNKDVEFMVRRVIGKA